MPEERAPSTQLNPGGGTVSSKDSGAVPFGCESRVSASHRVISVGQMWPWLPVQETVTAFGWAA